MNKENLRDVMNDVESEIPSSEDEIPTQGNKTSDWIKEMVFTEDDMNALRETIPTLNFIELESMRRDLNNTKIQLEAAKEYADSFCRLEKDAQSDDSMSKKIELSDAESKVNDAINVYSNTELRFAVNEFVDNYEETMTNIAAIDDLINTTMEEKYDNAEKTTTFLTDCTIDMLTKRIANLGEIPENPTSPYDKDRKAYHQKLCELVEIFKSRNKTDMILELLPNAQQFLTHLKRDLRNDPKGIKLNGAKHAVGKAFGKVMHTRVLQSAEAFLTEHIGEENTFYLIYAMHCLHWRLMEKEDIRSKCIELFFTNCSDIHTGIYDYCGGSQEWISNVRELSQKVNQMLKK